MAQVSSPELPRVLRALGQFLDMASATRVEITVAPGLQVAWQAGDQPGARRFTVDELLLRDRDRQARRVGRAPSEPPGYEEPLRVLGQLLAEQGFEVERIAQEQDHFWVEGHLAPQAVRRPFPRAELLAESQARRQLRRPSPGSSPSRRRSARPWWRRWLRG